MALDHLFPLGIVLLALIATRVALRWGVAASANVADSRLARVANLANIGALFVAVVGLLLLLTKQPLTPLPLSLAPAFGVVSPAEGGVVGPVATVRAATPFAGVHYVVVTSPTGVHHVQGGPLTPSTSGTLSARAAFGDRDVGRGGTYTICIVRTDAPLGLVFDRFPPDARVSDPVHVLRQ